MYGFTHVRTDKINVFQNSALDFTLELFSDGSGAFYIKGKGKTVKFPSPAKKLLGEPYQPQCQRLGYPMCIPWWANAAHELLHVWYGQTYENGLSRNHATLMELDNASTKICDTEELMVTTLQLYANIPSLHTQGSSRIRRAVRFQKWIESCVTSNSLTSHSDESLVKGE